MIEKFLAKKNYLSNVQNLLQKYQLRQLKTLQIY